MWHQEYFQSKFWFLNFESKKANLKTFLFSKNFTKNIKASKIYFCCPFISCFAKKYPGKLESAVHSFSQELQKIRPPYFKFNLFCLSGLFPSQSFNKPRFFPKCWDASTNVVLGSENGFIGRFLMNVLWLDFAHCAFHIWKTSSIRLG